jgi:hypothetical protein
MVTEGERVQFLKELKTDLERLEAKIAAADMFLDSDELEDIQEAAPNIDELWDVVSRLLQGEDE